MLKTLRRLLLATFAASVVAGAYAAAPFYTAWSIREAIKAGDSGYLEGKIQWPTVRASLKESLGKLDFGANGEVAAAPERPTLWQRVKAYVGQGAIDRFVETTVTPTGMSGLMGMRKAYRSGEAALTGEEAPAPLHVRVGRFWSRVSRAEFVSLDRFELDVVDKETPERTFAAVLERRGFEWKMTELRLKPTSPGRMAAAART